MKRQYKTLITVLLLAVLLFIGANYVSFGQQQSDLNNTGAEMTPLLLRFRMMSAIEDLKSQIKKREQQPLTPENSSKLLSLRVRKYELEKTLPYLSADSNKITGKTLDDLNIMELGLRSLQSDIEDLKKQPLSSKNSKKIAEMTKWAKALGDVENYILEHKLSPVMKDSGLVDPIEQDAGLAESDKGPVSRPIVSFNTSGSSSQHNPNEGWEAVDPNSRNQRGGGSDLKTLENEANSLLDKINQLLGQEFSPENLKNIGHLQERLKGVQEKMRERYQEEIGKVKPQPQPPTRRPHISIDPNMSPEDTLDLLQKLKKERKLTNEDLEEVNALIDRYSEIVYSDLLGVILVKNNEEANKIIAYMDKAMREWRLPVYTWRYYLLMHNIGKDGIGDIATPLLSQVSFKNGEKVFEKDGLLITSKDNLGFLANIIGDKEGVLKKPNKKDYSIGILYTNPRTCIPCMVLAKNLDQLMPDWKDYIDVKYSGKDRFPKSITGTPRFVSKDGKQMIPVWQVMLNPLKKAKTNYEEAKKKWELWQKAKKEVKKWCESKSKKSQSNQ